MIDKIEKRALKITVFVNFVMAIAGWITFYLTNSQAMLLDGNFSFILAIATIVAINISKNKHNKTATFPFGSYVYEAAFVLTKGLLILGIITVAFSQNSIKIIEYINGEKIEVVEITPIYYYSAFIMVVTIALISFFYSQNKKIDGKSSMLLVEADSAKVDGALTFATGIAFFLISFVSLGSKLDFLIYIGDSIIVLIISIVMIRVPIRIIRDSFIELTGGTIQNKNDKEEIEIIIDKTISNMFPYSTFISKVGSSLLVIIFIDQEAENISINEFRTLQHKVEGELQNKFPTTVVEITLGRD